MSIPMNDLDILDDSKRSVAHAKIPPLPYIRYIGGREDPDSFQCRKRPFRLSMACWQHLDDSAEHATRLNGNQLYADTGEAFVYKRLVPPAPPIMPRAPKGEGDFDDVWGVQIKRFTSPEGYLDSFAMQIFDTPPQRLLQSEYLDQTPAQVEKAEMDRTMYLQNDYASSPSGGFNWVEYRALRRTQIRYYLGMDRLGNSRYCAVGAHFEGDDLLIFTQGVGITDVLNRSSPFGSAPLARAYANDVLWETQQRFAASFIEEDISFDEFAEVVRGFARSVEFSKERMSKMRAESERLRNNDYERLRQEREASHRLLEQLKADHARHEANRTRMEQASAKRQAMERAAAQKRRDSWNRQQELDRRRRNAWSDAIRDVDRYEHPYDGGTIEVRSGYGHRAFYNASDDSVITADSSIDVPFGYEELKRKD